MAEKCPCKGDYLDKLLQPAILAVLSGGPAYGLELLRELDELDEPGRGKKGGGLFDKIFNKNKS